MTRQAQTAQVLERLQRLGDLVEDRFPGMSEQGIRAFMMALQTAEAFLDRREGERRG